MPFLKKNQCWSPTLLKLGIFTREIVIDYTDVDDGNILYWQKIHQYKKPKKLLNLRTLFSGRYLS